MSKKNVAAFNRWRTVHDQSGNEGHWFVTGMCERCGLGYGSWLTIKDIEEEQSHCTFWAYDGTTEEVGKKVLSMEEERRAISRGQNGPYARISAGLKQAAESQHDRLLVLDEELKRANAFTSLDESS